MVDTVTRYTQVTTSQLRRLHYVGTDRGTRARAGLHTKKLYERGFITRLPYRLSGWNRGSGEFIYAPQREGKLPNPNLHTLHITELYVRLRVAVPDVRFDPEPWAPTSYKGHEITADAFVQIPGGSAYWIEVDLNSESPAVLSKKMDRYVRAFKGPEVTKFPVVVWLAHDRDRVRTLQRVARSKNEPGLFLCLLFDDAVAAMSSN